MSGLTRFLGDTPLRVALRLVVLSFLVGLILSALRISPADVLFWIERVVWQLYDMGFSLFANGFQYLIVGAVIVVPIFLLARVLRLGSSRPRQD